MGAAVALLGLAGCGLIAGLSDHELDTRAQDGGGADDGTVGDEARLSDAPGVTEAGCSADLQSDAKHCGSCGHDCMGGECKAGACQPVLLAGSEGALPLQIAVIKDEVFWIQGPPSKRIFRATPAGSGFDATEAVRGIVPIGARLLVSFNAASKLRSLDPGNPAFEQVDGQENLTPFLVHDGAGRAAALRRNQNAQFSVETFVVGDGGAPQLVEPSVDPGNATYGLFAGGSTLVVHNSAGLALCRDWKCRSENPSTLVGVSSDVKDTDVMAVTFPVGSAAQLSTVLVASTKDQLFFAEPRTGALKRVSLDGGSRGDVGTWPQLRATSLVLDEPYAYVSRQGSDAGQDADVVRCLQTGCVGGATVLFQGTAARALAVGERAIYWAGTKDGKTGVWLLAK